MLRDAGEGSAPRRAVSVEGLPVVRHEHRGWTSLPDEERDRHERTYASARASESPVSAPG